MSEQLIFDSGFARHLPHTDAGAVADACDQMEAFLSRSGGRWVTRAEFRSELGLCDRMCRAGREHSDGRIIAGQHGYKLMRDSTPEEVGAYLAGLHAQISAMQDQHAIACKRAYEMGIFTHEQERTV